MRSGCAILLNLRSRTLQKNPRRIDRIRTAFGNRGPVLLPRDLSELPTAISELQRARPEFFFVCGGDGTIHQTITALVHGYGDDPLPKIVILPAGTMNTIDRGLNGSGDPLCRIERIVAHIDQELPLSSIRRHPIALNDRYGFIFAVGGFASFIERYSAVPVPTPQRAIAMLTRISVSSLIGGSYAKELFPMFQASLRIDGQELPTEGVTTVSASAIRHLGFGFRPFPGAEGGDGAFGFLVLTDSPRAFLPHLCRLYRGKPIESPTLRQEVARELVIRTDREIVSMADGELFPPRKEFTLRVGPALDFVTG
ncbi:MAG: diacylglycerol kinase family protein [Pseudomonadota bacterium]